MGESSNLKRLFKNVSYINAFRIFILLSLHECFYVYVYVGKIRRFAGVTDKLPEQRNALSDTKLSRHSDCMQWKCFTWFLFLMHFELTFDFRGFFKRQSDPVHVLYSTVAIRGGGNGTVTEVLTKQIKVLTTCTLLNSFVSFLGRYSVI